MQGIVVSNVPTCKVL